MADYYVAREPDRPWRGGNLNVRELLGPLFFSRSVRHPDAKRQRKARIATRALRQARALKAMTVPSVYVPVVATGRFRQGVQYFTPREVFIREYQGAPLWTDYDYHDHSGAADRALWRSLTGRKRLNDLLGRCFNGPR